MTGFSKVFLDTTPLIYFLDNDVNFGDKTRQIFESILNSKKQIVSSTITCTEYLTFPYKLNNTEKSMFSLSSPRIVALHYIL